MELHAEQRDYRTKLLLLVVLVFLMCLANSASAESPFEPAFQSLEKTLLAMQPLAIFMSGLLMLVGTLTMRLGAIVLGLGNAIPVTVMGWNAEAGFALMDAVSVLVIVMGLGLGILVIKLKYDDASSDVDVVIVESAPAAQEPETIDSLQSEGQGTTQTVSLSSSVSDLETAPSQPIRGRRKLAID